jgi:hypothetical protein
VNKILISLILFIFSPAISIACSITASDKTNGGVCVDVGGGHQMYVQILGKPAPVVIFDSGAGNDSTAWNALEVATLPSLPSPISKLRLQSCGPSL